MRLRTMKRNARCETAAVCRTLNTLGWSWTCTFFFSMLIPTALGNIVIVEIMIILSSHALNTPWALGPLGPSTMVFIWSLWRLCVYDIKRWSPRVPIYVLYILWWTNIHIYIFIYIYGSYRLFIVSHTCFFGISHRFTANMGSRIWRLRDYDFVQCWDWQPTGTDIEMLHELVFWCYTKNHIKVEEVKFHMFLFAEQLSGTLPLFGLSFGEHTWHNPYHETINKSHCGQSKPIQKGCRFRQLRRGRWFCNRDPPFHHVHFGASLKPLSLGGANISAGWLKPHDQTSHQYVLILH